MSSWDMLDTVSVAPNLEKKSHPLAEVGEQSLVGTRERAPQAAANTISSAPPQTMAPWASGARAQLPCLSPSWM